jgi:50S ribosomal subunit-associated GTPase HflX
VGDARLVHVFNKMDRVNEPDAFKRLAAAGYSNAVFVSAMRGEIEELSQVLVGAVPSRLT